jgi:hypothetical protein
MNWSASRAEVYKPLPLFAPIIAIREVTGLVILLDGAGIVT